MPHQLTFNQTLKIYLLTKAKFYPSNPTKTEKTHGRITLEQEINPVQIPTLLRQRSNSPPPPGTMHSQMPGVCPRGMLKLRFDRHTMLPTTPCDFLEMDVLLFEILKKHTSKFPVPLVWFIHCPLPTTAYIDRYNRVLVIKEHNEPGSLIYLPRNDK